ENSSSRGRSASESTTPKGPKADGRGVPSNHRRQEDGRREEGRDDGCRGWTQGRGAGRAGSRPRLLRADLQEGWGGRQGGARARVLREDRQEGRRERAREPWSRVLLADRSQGRPEGPRADRAGEAPRQGECRQGPGDRGVVLGRPGSDGGGRLERRTRRGIAAAVPIPCHRGGFIREGGPAMILLMRYRRFLARALRRPQHGARALGAGIDPARRSEAPAAAARAAGGGGPRGGRPR